MKRNLLIGIIGGAAIGAAASYLLSSENRRNLASGLGNRFNSLLGSDEEDDDTTISASSNNNGSATGRSANSGRAGGLKKRTTGRRG